MIVSHAELQDLNPPPDPKPRKLLAHKPLTLNPCSTVYRRYGSSTTLWQGIAAARIPNVPWIILRCEVEAGLLWQG